MGKENHSQSCVCDGYKRGATQTKRGRPKTSPHDLATQRKLNLQRHRQAKRDENQVPVEIYLPQEWHDWLVNVRGANLREVAVEAFAAWLEKERVSSAESFKVRQRFAEGRGLGTTSFSKAK